MGEFIYICLFISLRRKVIEVICFIIFNIEFVMGIKLLIGIEDFFFRFKNLKLLYLFKDYFLF